MAQSDTVNPEQNNENSTTTRKRKNRKWSKEGNMFIMECYSPSNPSRLRYWKRMLELAKYFLTVFLFCFFYTEQWLVDQANNICESGWLTEIELGEIKWKLEFDNATGIILILIMLHIAREKYYYHVWRGTIYWTSRWKP